jgi:uncharacterized protein (TIGR02466 family)
MKEEVKITYAFPIFIKQYKNFLSNQECKKIISFSKKEKLKNHNALIGDSYSSYHEDSNILDNISLNIKNKIIDRINNYVDEWGIDNVKLTNSWVNFQKKNSKLDMHCHPKSVVSGVMFLKTDLKSSNLYFYNPNPYIYLNTIKKNTCTNYSHIRFIPNIGDMILFPSWLQHGSNKDINLSSERIVLSFNTL